MPILPVFDVDDEPSPDFERVLWPVAERAKAGDRGAIEAVFTSFLPKIRRFVRRVQVPPSPRGDRGLWDRDDVYQEACLVFLRLIERWPPGIPFGRYFLANFPWRLRDAVARHVARRGLPPRAMSVSIDAANLSDRIPDGGSSDWESRVLIEAVASSLASPHDAILRCHVLEGLNLTETAHRLDVNRRTVTRHWRALRDTLERESNRILLAS